MASQTALPQTMRALILDSTSEPLTVRTVPTPQPGPGSAVVRILAASVVPYARDVYNGERNYAFPTPLIPGGSAIGRIAAVGPDATTLKTGDLVLMDPNIRGRDGSTDIMLLGLHEGFTDGSRKLMRGEWRNSTDAEYCKMPLENLALLNEKILLSSGEDGGLGYTVEDLSFLRTLLVPYGGLRDIDLKAGETVIISPATGSFGGAAILVALAMGARVIAMGRNVSALEAIKAANARVEIVPITGDTAVDTAALTAFGPADAFLDISPAAAAKSTHFKSGILALRPGGRVSMMGGITEDIPLPHMAIMTKNLKLQGKWMYERSDVQDMIKMVERGVMGLGERVGARVVGAFGLDDWATAFETAADNAGMGQVVVIRP